MAHHTHYLYTAIFLGIVFCVTPVAAIHCAQPLKQACAPKNSQGREFLLAFMETMSPSADPRLYIISASARSTRVTIQSPRHPHLSVTISHESRIKVINENGPSTSAVLVTADNEVTVYGVEEGNSMDSFLVLPTEALGTEYFIVSYSISIRLSRDQRKSQFTLIGVLDGTLVDITLAGTVQHNGRRYWRGDRIRVTLDRLQVMHLYSSDDDLTGTWIVADKKIGVLSGSKCADVPVNMQYCDHLVEMLPPVQSWGKTFITSPLYGRRGGDAFRIMAARNSTTVTVSTFGSATLHAGEYFEMEITSNSSRSISADKPLLVMQYSLGGAADQSLGDPFMMLLPAVEQFSGNAAFYTIESSVDTQLTSYANVVIECKDVRGLQHNYFEVPQSSFSRLDRLRHTVNGHHYCTAQMTLARGEHFLRHTNPDVRFSLVLYGMGTSQGSIAYGMPAGLRLPGGRCDTCVPVVGDTSTVSTPDIRKATPARPAVPECVPGSNSSPPSGPSVNGAPSQSSGKYLTLAVFVALFSLVTIVILVIYIVILRRRIRKLEAERKAFSRIQLSPVMVGADGYIGLDGSQHPERDYMTLNNPQGVWRLGRVRRTGRSEIRYVANTAINTNSNGISHISEPTLVPARNSVHGASAAAVRKASAPETFNRTLSVDSSHALRFTRRNSSNDVTHSNNQRHSAPSVRHSPPDPSLGRDGGAVARPNSIASTADGAGGGGGGAQTARDRKQSFQELHDIAECPDKEPPPRTSHLVRSVSQPSYQTSIKVNAQKVYYSVPKGCRGRHHSDRRVKRSGSVEEPCPVIFSMKESLLKHDDGYMSMRDHRTSVSSHGSSNVSVTSGPVAHSPPEAPYSFVPDEANDACADTAETDSTDYTELFE